MKYVSMALDLIADFWLIIAMGCAAYIGTTDTIIASFVVAFAIDRATDKLQG